jgi:hypothetical protein
MKRLSPSNVFAVVGSSALSALVIYWYLGLHSVFGFGPLGLLLVVVAASGIWWVADAVWHHRHRGNLRDFAEHHGWEFRERTSEYRSRFSSYPFGQGTDRADLDLLRGTFHGRECATFTRRYDMGSDDSNAMVNFQITLVELSVNLPTVDLIPADAFTRMANLMGGTNIGFESAEFNSYWHVKSTDARYAHALLHPRMLHRLNRADARDYFIRFEGRAVLMWRPDRSGTEDLARRFGVLTTLAGLVPPHLEREHLELEAERQRMADGMARARMEAEKNAPEWARNPGALTSRKYTGIDSDKYGGDAKS